MHGRIYTILNPVERFFRHVEITQTAGSVFIWRT